MSIGWKHEIAVLNDFKADWDDKLLVVDDGRLYLEKGSVCGALFIKPSDVVVRQLDALIEISAKECFEFLKGAKSDRAEFYEQVVVFKREVKCLHTRLDQMKEALDQSLITRSSQLLEEVKEFKSTLTRPPLSQRPVKHFVYDERMNSNYIKKTHPKRVPLEDTVTAALKALSLVDPQAYALPAILGGTIKELIWNPFERTILGKVMSLPHENWTDHYMRFQARQECAFRLFTNQLLCCPRITDQVVDAFAKLAHAVEHLDLHFVNLIAEDIVELAPYITPVAPGRITPLAFLKGVKRVCPNHAINLNHFLSVYSICESPNCPSEESSLDDYLRNHLDLLKPRKARSFITEKVLLRLLEIAAASKTCGRIYLNGPLENIPSVKELLAKEHFRKNRSAWIKLSGW